TRRRRRVRRTRRSRARGSSGGLPGTPRELVDRVGGRVVRRPREAARLAAQRPVEWLHELGEALERAAPAAAVPVARRGRGELALLSRVAYAVPHVDRRPAERVPRSGETAGVEAEQRPGRPLRRERTVASRLCDRADDLEGQEVADRVDAARFDRPGVEDDEG